ncbi:GNAT family N-acetyltransferase [Kibdelosporangium philippinense]|uniref:GNAT family N-acetyltransferase n=1 Tax=Kibdelosporangium philippinense TaxID=211113 RepID=A0ABS8Z5Q5_9PSEU|nr:GNAT family N-acetyltransferase [Kibdelosporangium philippinense]MCE7003209.1 GNAT family N-acetyltransferase [Kibdelosporangium philippinense]
MKRLKIRPMRDSDIEEWVAIYLDERVQSNINHEGVLAAPDELRARVREWLASDRLFFRIGTGGGDLVGFARLSKLDWISQRCDLTVMVDPRHRSRLGLLAHIAMYDHIYDSLNLRVVVHEVLSGNTMMRTEEYYRSRAHAITPDHCFTVGVQRTCYWWVETRAEHHAILAETAERGARVRRRVAGKA